ncbi:MAG: hybrid sensor histidine kinase/response regulator [Bacteroidetes bacterium]|nr:hybrid sensor histidine kinase/response regulator [Bacteroidota bacterium]
METSKANILIVDDNINNIKVVGSILKSDEYEVEFALNGKDAVVWLEEQPFDLILLDVMMPEMDGFEACSLIKKIPDRSDIPVIFFTAKTDAESIKRGFHAGGVDYITKPFNPEELLARVDTHIRLKRSGDIIRKQNEKLESLLATRDRFFSIIAHDLKNPVYGLYILAENTEKQVGNMTPGQLVEFIKEIKDASAESYDLLEKLLEWSRLQTGSLAADPARLNLGELIQKVVSLFSGNAESKRINLTTGSDGDLYAFADKNMTETVLRNLVSNAMKYTGENGTVKITAKTKGRYVEIAVSDTGTGIKNEHKHKLLRIDDKYIRKGMDGEKGTGLGLILCKEFVEQNGGEIRFESEWGKGSVFYFTVPVTV